jgi:hypothetical protein
MTSSDSFFHTQAMQGVFITPAYQQIAAVADLWGVSQIRLGLGLDLSLSLGFIMPKFSLYIVRTDFNTKYLFYKVGKFQSTVKSYQNNHIFKVLRKLKKLV